MRLVFTLTNLFFVFLLSISSVGYSQNSNKKTTRNPDISLNSLIEYGTSSRKDGSNIGLQLREIELNFSSDIDAYFRGVAILGIHQHAHEEEEHHGEEEEEGEEEGHDEEGHEEEEEFAIEPEEVYVETIAIPFVTLKLGKFFAAFGKHNIYHAHAYPFLDQPQFITELLGEEGLNDLGLSAEVLLPLPWYTALTVQAIEDGEAFESENKSDVVTIVNLKNLWDVTDSTTLEVGLSSATGKNTADKETSLKGADITVKWRPEFLSNYSSLSLTGEYIESDRSGIEEEKHAGWVGWVKYQFDKNWRIGLRTEEIGILSGKNKSIETKKNSALVAYHFSEFSSLRFQYDQIKDQLYKTPERRFTMQLNMSIGTHPAHRY